MKNPNIGSGQVRITAKKLKSYLKKVPNEFTADDMHAKLNQYRLGDIGLYTIKSYIGRMKKLKMVEGSNPYKKTKRYRK